MSNIIIVKINDIIKGYYDSKDLVDIFINSCLNCNFIKKTDDIILEYYKMNSFILIEIESFKLNKHYISNDSIKEVNKYEKINKCEKDNKCEKVNKYEKDNKYEEFSESESESDNNSYHSVDATEFLNKKKLERELFNKLIEQSQEQIDITSSINKLKLEKQKIEEQENTYNYDLNLYYKFKDMKNKKPHFIIPELFINKYDLFITLENNNNLNFDSFISNYVKEEITTSYFDLFEGQEYAYKIPVPEDFKNDSIDEIINII